MDPALPRPGRHRELLASWRSWIDSDLDPAGPAWLQWVWTLLFAAAIALAFTLMGMAASIGLRAEAWLDGALWWRWYRANFVVSLTIAVLIHLLFAAAVPLAGRARIRGWTPARRAVFFTGVPLLGVLVGWPIGIWLVGQQGLGWVRLGGTALVGSAAIGLVISLAIFLVFNARAQKADAEKRAAEAQLRLLQAQMEPHFLFNTLANVQTLVATDPPRAGRMLEAFTDYLRATLGHLRRDDSSVGAEVELARAYLQLLQMRMAERLRFSIDVDPALRDRPLPPLLLQPLVENAVRHGLEPQLEGGHVGVRVHADGGVMEIEVRDDGQGPDAPRGARAPSSGNGVALANLRARLQARHGNAASLRIEPAGPGTRAVLRLPLTAPPRSPA
jgi:two-component sensor histidine kinase